MLGGERPPGDRLLRYEPGRLLGVWVGGISGGQLEHLPLLVPESDRRRRRTNSPLGANF